LRTGNDVNIAAHRPLASAEATMSVAPPDLDAAEAALGRDPDPGAVDHKIEQNALTVGSGAGADAAGGPDAAPGLCLRRHVASVATAVVAASTLKDPKRVKKLINLLETERDKEGWSTQKRKKIKKILKKGRTGKTGDEYDVFLSYRVAADQKLVEELYWRLVGMMVMDNGRERNLRVFWDKKCLRSGESWEVC